MKLRSLVLTGLLLGSASIVSAAGPIGLKVADPAVRVTSAEAGMMRSVSANPRLASLATALRAENAAGRMNIDSPAAARTFLVNFAQKSGLGTEVVAMIPSVSTIEAAQKTKVSLAATAAAETHVASDLDLLNQATGSCDLTAAVSPSTLVAAAGNAVSVAEVKAAESTLSSVVNALEFNGLPATIAANFSAMVETSAVEGAEGQAGLIKGIQIATEHGADAVSARAAQALANDGVIDTAEAEAIETCYFVEGLATALGNSGDAAAADAQAYKIGAACSVETTGKQMTEEALRQKCAA